MAMTKGDNKREPIPQKLRFEIFKRDSFKCQYCGASAPEVLLHIDHIKPVSKGGTNEILNLITSCKDCNSGKRDIPLDDNAVINKQKAQLEELQERREQLELLMQWKDGLLSIKNDTVDKMCEFWEKVAPGYQFNQTGKQRIKNLLNKYTYDEIVSAMEIAANQYIRFDNKGNATSESWNNGFNKVSGICYFNKNCKENDDIKQLHYIKGIARNRCTYYFNEKRAWILLKTAYDGGSSINEIKEEVFQATNWSEFKEYIENLIDINNFNNRGE